MTTVLSSLQLADMPYKPPIHSVATQLQNLNILKYSRKMFASVDEFYELVIQIPGLHDQSLYLANLIATPFLATHRVPVHFPLLERIEIQSTNLVLGPCTTPTLCWNILGFIIPRLGCSIRVLTSYVCTNDILAQAATVLSCYARNYFEIYPDGSCVGKQPKPL